MPNLNLSIDTPKDTLVGTIDIEPIGLNNTGKVQISLDEKSPYFYVKDGKVYTKYSGLKIFNDPKLNSIELGVTVMTPDGKFPVE